MCVSIFILVLGLYVSVRTGLENKKLFFFKKVSLKFSDFKKIKKKLSEGMEFSQRISQTHPTLVLSLLVHPPGHNNLLESTFFPLA